MERPISVLDMFEGRIAPEVERTFRPLRRLMDDESSPKEKEDGDAERGRV